MPVLLHAVRRFVPSASFGPIMPRYGNRLAQGICMGVLGGCGRVLAVTVGCLTPTLQSETIDVVR